LWVQKGYYLDLGNVPKELRPPLATTRFVYVVNQEMTEMEDITATIPANKASSIDFSSSNLKDKLKPLDNMLFQCAWGFYPDFKAFLVHPTDNSVGKLPKELPSTNYRVGIIRNYDSPYENPNILKTEFWITPAEGCYTPQFWFYNYREKDETVYLRLLINMLVVEPIEDPELIRQLERRIKPSTPVRLWLFKS